MKELTENQANELGGVIAVILKLRKDREHKDRWQTTWGSKTNTGIVRVIERLFLEGDMQNPL